MGTIKYIKIKIKIKKIKNFPKHASHPPLSPQLLPISHLH